MRRTLSFIIAMCAVAVTVRTQPADRVAAAQRCFVETQQCIDGRIAEFWEQNGGLAVFGLPIAAPETITVDGTTIVSQRFERTRLELHPTQKAPYDVLLGRMGALRLAQQGRDWYAFPKTPAGADCQTFSQTGHAVCGDFLAAWRANGLRIDAKAAVSDIESLALFGLPLSGVITETLSDGKSYQVQWFERARFELHPDNPTPYRVLLGLLGTEYSTPQAQTTVAAAPAAVTPTPTVYSTEEYKKRVTAMPGGYWTTEFEQITFAVGGFNYYKVLYENTPGTGKRYLRCSVSINNRRSNMNDTVFIDTNRLTLVDADGRIYSVAKAPTKALPKGLIPSNAYPGRTISGEVVFEIPTSTFPAKILYRYDPTKPTVELTFNAEPFR
jgi:hypothetical protein